MKVIHPDQIIMPIGKYKGQALDDIPTAYLLWALDNMSDYPSLQKNIQAHLKLKATPQFVDKSFIEQILDYQTTYYTNQDPTLTKTLRKFSGELLAFLEVRWEDDSRRLESSEHCLRIVS